jgi:hypothetical protein
MQIAAFLPAAPPDDDMTDASSTSMPRQAVGGAVSPIPSAPAAMIAA